MVGIMQNAVDAVLDGHFLIARFDVNIAGSPFQRVKDGGIHQLDDRRDIRIRGRQLVDGERLVAETRWSPEALTALDQVPGLALPRTQTAIAAALVAFRREAGIREDLAAAL